MMNKRAAIACCIALLLMLAGCRTRREAAPEGGTAKGEKELFALLEEQAYRFETLTARLKVDLDVPGNRMSSRVDLKMVRDSAFALSVQPFLGIEVFRIEFSRDSIKLLDRMNKRYVAESYADLKRQEGTPFEFNYYNLQALFTNRLFLPGERRISPKQYKRFRYAAQGTSAELQTTGIMDLIYTFVADNEGKLTSARIAVPDNGYALQWLYGDFRVTADAGRRLFPMRMDVQLQKQQARLGGLTLYFSRLQADAPVQLDFVVPGKYKRVTGNQIVKSLIRKE